MSADDPLDPLDPLVRLTALTEDPHFEALLRHIRDERGFDFTGYKRASLVRRVRRRMEDLAVASFEEYLDHLLVHPDEFTVLFNTVLINVTGFFRDADAWTALREELLPGLLVHREGRSIRAWSAGCASGEEAYTLAIVLAEALGPEEFRERVKIYATDVDDEALRQARLATYPAAAVETVPAELRQQYFEATANRFVVRKDIRRAVIFGRNDLVQDAPISHVDLLLCRNTLMYFNAETQARILNRMHFALRPHGLMFLGKAEMLLSHAAYFRAVDLKRRFFTKVVTEPPERRPLATGPTVSAAVPDPARPRLLEAALAASTVAQLVLDRDNRLVLCNTRAAKLFGLGPRDLGRSIQDLEVSYRPVELRSHLDDAARLRRPVWVREVELARGAADPVILDVQVVPLTAGVTELGATVLSTDVTEQRVLQDELLLATRKLETAYEELQSSNEELETTNEELQSTVEELETTNEELQSTNEELETMNEELQSINDDLQQTNEVLHERQREVDQLNRFMGSVFSSMNSGVVVVDADMRVMAWNARSEDLWGIRGDEAVGEHLMNLDIGLPLEQLRQPVRAHLARGDAADVVPEGVRLSAVNRRGRPVEVTVTLTRIPADGDSDVAAMLVMDVNEASDNSGGEPPVR